ncbi:MAG: hypothetical protein SF052_12895 [Bacteroidia bacterium]|nr:hypothetical protein [Bacteroidia bacterium]
MKNYLFLLLFLALILAGFSSCGNEAKTEKPTEQYLPDSVSTEGMSKADIECFSHPDFICESGLEFVRLGDYIADVKMAELSEADIQDSVENGNGYEWLVRTLHLKEGKIVVEGEFLDQRYSNDSLLAVSKVNRLRIESSLFRTPSDVRVGMSLKEVLAVFEGAFIKVFPLPEFETINIQVDDQRYIYLINDPQNRISSAAGDDFSISDIPSDSPVSAIVVM